MFKTLSIMTIKLRFHLDFWLVVSRKYCKLFYFGSNAANNTEILSYFNRSRMKEFMVKEVL